ncbi:zinc-binding dehydrogenase [Amycolatopsis sp. FBCC-B4732]|uniref:zinc-binding dehydrogenase n=1 Tax=Amycolatopsis sp. FBCC-B4732 TaxID=3079339 RepID=UPI001FF2663A|nr:zinc-binding dehydrogenase [Amycolatopsis sp. FBCC-B4732]UOX91383.1 zinc-binding dehydrogenase [Amycolatopsis sp. FBCC-B4732]
MKAVAVQAFGEPGGMAVVDLPVPSPAGGQVLITTEAIGVGGVDVLIRRGALAAYGFREGHVLGGEIAGTVAAVGDGVDQAWLGRRVWAFAGAGTGGGYAEQALAPAETLVPLPEGVSPVDAVTLGSSGTVAHFALRHAQFAPGESVLVRGAAGGIGVMAVQLAARGGAGAIAVTTSSPERGDRLRQLGATHVFGRDGEGAEGYDVIVDIVAGPGLPSFFAKLNPNGRLVTVGVMGGDPPADFGKELLAGFRRSLSFATFSADTVPMADRTAVTADLFAGRLRAVVHGVLPLAEAASAHRTLDAGEVFGRFVLTTASFSGARDTAGA